MAWVFVVRAVQLSNRMLCLPALDRVTKKWFVSTVPAFVLPLVSTRRHSHIKKSCKAFDMSVLLRSFLTSV